MASTRPSDSTQLAISLARARVDGHQLLGRVEALASCQVRRRTLFDIRRQAGRARLSASDQNVPNSKDLKNIESSIELLHLSALAPRAPQLA